MEHDYTEWPLDKLEDKLFDLETSGPHNEPRASQVGREIAYLLFELGQRQANE